MYEEKEKRKIEIRWKPLLIKIAILLVVVFLVLWIISLFNREEEKASNFEVNFSSMRNAATEYFTGSRLPSELNESTSITLEEMFERNLLIEFQDENGEACDLVNSYAEATKISESDYRIEVRLVCSNESDTIINTVRREVTDSNDENIDLPEDSVDDEGEDHLDDSFDDNDDSSGQNNNDSNNQSGTGNNNSGSSKPNNGSSGGNNSNNSSSSDNNNNNSNNSDHNQDANTCVYGKKEYSTTYPLAYVVSGDCAVSLSSIRGTHENNASSIGIAEYTKLVQEIQTLKNATGANLTVSAPQYSVIQNKAGTGYVGYQIYFSVKQKINSYATKTIYSYYLDQNGNRRVIVDTRSSITNTDIEVTSVTLNRSTLSLEVGDTYTFSATVNPSNVTNKTVSWSSSNSSVIQVNSNGKVIALKSGSAVVTARAGNKQDTVKITVTNPVQISQKTYYYAAMINRDSNGGGFIQTIRINDLKKNDVRSVRVRNEEFFNSTNDYRNYVSIQDDVEFYDRYGSTIPGGVSSYSKMQKSSLKEGEFSFEITDVYYYGNSILIDLRFTYQTARTIPTYENTNLVFLPIQFDLVYEEV